MKISSTERSEGFVKTWWRKDLKDIPLTIKRGTRPTTVTPKVKRIIKEHGYRIISDDKTFLQNRVV